ncbi:hypothetical protein B0H14DRAFT_2559725 [Mycena olivaceomarginata]|nr:hypothetical protein B0H14DRAFT_2559725 [Mycena olivaceomarginata]
MSRSGLPRSAAARRTHPLPPRGLNAVTGSRRVPLLNTHMRYVPPHPQRGSPYYRYCCSRNRRWYNCSAEAQLTEQQARIDQSAGDIAATAAVRAEEIARAVEDARVLDANEILANAPPAAHGANAAEVHASHAGIRVSKDRGLVGQVLKVQSFDLLAKVMLAEVSSGRMRRTIVHRSSSPGYRKPPSPSLCPLSPPSPPLPLPCYKPTSASADTREKFLIGVADNTADMDNMNGPFSSRFHALLILPRVDLIFSSSAFQPFAVITSNNTPIPIPTVTENSLKQRLFANESIGIYYEPTAADNDSNGKTRCLSLSFGGSDISKCTSEINYVPITKTDPACSNRSSTKASVTMGRKPWPTAPASQTQVVQAHPDAQTWPRSQNENLGILTDAICLIFASQEQMKNKGLDFINKYPFLSYSAEFQSIRTVKFKLYRNTYQIIFNARRDSALTPPSS